MWLLFDVGIIKKKSDSLRKMAAQLSTSASDALLAWSVLYFIFHLHSYNFFACLGIAIHGIAASLGVVRFAQARQTGAIYDYHQMASWLAQVVGLPLMAAGFCYKDLPIVMNLNLMMMFAVLVTSRSMAPGRRQQATLCCSAFALLTIAVISYRAHIIYGLYGTAAYVLSGVIGSQGKVGPIYRVDLLHVVLTAGNILYTWALLQL
ncbi:hypothetical protein PoB_005697300 [Plakobranchus ocellatus]|uniref:Uncharacterized protein n=1 Tax=Plakobranchus ocellatus TaxID=259542 RepID=A0AAV4CG46_9GAST|nr:hypothetical protein PoB_005697300 [Plakobranchus ocellatus]